MGFFRQEYWVCCHFFLKGIFLTQGLYPGSCIADRFFSTRITREAIIFVMFTNLELICLVIENFGNCFFFFVNITLSTVSSSMMGRAWLYPRTSPQARCWGPNPSFGNPLFPVKPGSFHIVYSICRILLGGVSLNIEKEENIIEFIESWIWAIPLACAFCLPSCVSPILKM